MRKRSLWLAGFALLLGAVYAYGTQRDAQPGARASQPTPREAQADAPEDLVHQRLRALDALPKRETKVLSYHEAQEARALLDGLVSLFQRRLDSDPLQAQTLRCERETPGDPSCSALRNNALWSAASYELLPRVPSSVAKLTSLCGGDLECAKQLLGARLQNPSSAFDTIIALSVRLSLDPGQPIELPPQLYERLEQRSDLELDLILTSHSGFAVPEPKAADAIASLALAPGTSGRVRVSAMHALGHPENAPALRAVLDALESGAPETEVLLSRALPYALMRCGEACTGDLESLAHHADARVRQTAYRALDFMDEEESAQLSARWPARDPSNGE